MGREIRYVSKDWVHPKKKNGKFIPLLCGEYIEEDRHRDDFSENIYMPDWKEEEKTHIMMYENVSEGTPISPSFKRNEEELLAKWLFDNKANAGFGQTATYEQWLCTIKRKFAPTIVINQDNDIKTGVSIPCTK